MLADQSDVNPYLQQDVLSASPARLRWMLIRRAEELCGLVGQFWEGDQTELAAQWLLRIREILGELLDGVQDKAHPQSGPISDLYVYLLKLATETEIEREHSKLQSLQELLAIESETWRLVTINVASESQPELSFGGDAPLVQGLPVGLTSSYAGTEGGAFNLEI